MKATPLFPLAALLLVGCQDVMRPVELDPPSLTHVVGPSNLVGVIQLADIGGASTVVGRTVIITDPRGKSTFHCGDGFIDYRSVMVNLGGGGAITVTVGISPAHTIEPGDRFLITEQEVCAGTLTLRLERQ